MSDDSITIRFGADTAELQAAFAQAKAALVSLSDQIGATSASTAPMEAATRRVIEQYDKGAVTLRRGGEAYQAISEALENNEITATAATRALNQVTASAEDAAKASERLGTVNAGTAREFFVLGHEAMTGNFSRIPGSIMEVAMYSGRLGEIISALMSPFGLATAAAAAFAGALLLIKSNANETRDAIDGVQTALANMGRGNTGAGAEVVLSHQLTDLARSSGLAVAAAEKIKAAIESIPEASDRTRLSLERMTAAYANMNKLEPDKAAAALAESFQSVSGIDSLTRKLRLLTDAEKDHMAAAVAAGNLDLAQKIGVVGMERRYGSNAAAARANNEQGSVTKFFNGQAADYQSQPVTDDAAFKVQTQADAKALPSTAEASIAQFRLLAEAEGETKAKIDADVVDMWKGILAETQSAGAGVEAASKAELAAEAAARKSAGQDAVAGEELKLARIKAAGATTTAQDLAAKIDSDKRLLQNANITGDERVKIATRVLNETAKLRDERNSSTGMASQLATWRAQLEDMRAASKSSQLQMLQDDLAFWKSKSANLRSGSAEAIAVQREIAKAQIAADNEIEAEAKKASQVKQAIDKEETASAIALSRIKMQTEKDALDAAVAAGRSSYQDRYAALADFENKSFSDDDAALKKELDTLHQGDLAWQQAYDKREQMAATHQRNLSQLTLKLSTDEEAAAKKSEQAWQSVFIAPVGRAMDSMVTGILQGTQTLQQAFAKAGLNMAVALAESFLKMSASAAAFEALRAVGWTKMAAMAQTSEAAELRSVVTAETVKTAATKTGTTARTAADQSENAGFFTRIGLQLSKWLGLESGKTAATSAGEGARTTAVAGGEEARAAVTIPAEMAQISDAAAVAGANAFAFASIFGPEASAGAAAAAESETLGFMGQLGASGFSAAGGWDQVPFDGAITELHKDEMVLPASIAGPLRAMTQTMPAYGLPSGLGQAVNPGLSGARAGGGDTHHHFSPTTHVTVNNSGGRALSPDDVGSAVQSALRNGHAGLILQLKRMK